MERIGRRATQHVSSLRADVQYRLLDSDLPNAVSLPGGYVYITRGLYAEKKLATLLVTVAVTGGTMFQSCGLADWRNTVIAGTQGFAQSYVASFFAAFIPSPESLLATGDDADDGADDDG